MSIFPKNNDMYLDNLVVAKKNNAELLYTIQFYLLIKRIKFVLLAKKVSKNFNLFIFAFDNLTYEFLKKKN